MSDHRLGEAERIAEVKRMAAQDLEARKRKVREPIERIQREKNTLRAAEASKRWTILAAGAAAFALFASLAAYRLAFSDDEHDRRWRAEQRHFAAEQTELLREIRDRLPVQ